MRKLNMPTLAIAARMPSGVEHNWFSWKRITTIGDCRTDAFRHRARPEHLRKRRDVIVIIEPMLSGVECLQNCTDAAQRLSKR